jgi:hypothetical protein
MAARYAVGYAVHEHSGQKYVIRERDAHAWCLVWDPAKRAWVDFDTTPASWVAEEARRANGWEWFSDLWSQVAFLVAKFRWGQTNLRQYILWGLIPVLGLLLLQIIFRRGRKRQPQTAAAAIPAVVALPGLDSEFYLIEQQLAARTIPRQPGEPLSAWLTRALADPALAGLRQPLLNLLPLHYAYRFDPHGLDGRERQELASQAQLCLTTLSGPGRTAD